MFCVFDVKPPFFSVDIQVVGRIQYSFDWYREGFNEMVEKRLEKKIKVVQLKSGSTEVGETALFGDSEVASKRKERSHCLVGQRKARKTGENNKYCHNCDVDVLLRLTNLFKGLVVFPA